MPDLTPQPMSEELIRRLMIETYGMEALSVGPNFARAIEAHVNEQWRQRMELRAHESASGMLLGIQNPLPSDTPIYRIKEQE